MADLGQEEEARNGRTLKDWLALAPESWDEDLRNTWARLQVAEERVMEYRASWQAARNALGVDPDFIADLMRSRTKYPGIARMFDGLMGELDELRRAYAGDGDRRAEAFDVAVCAYRIATEGDAGGNARLEQAPTIATFGRSDGTSAQEMIQEALDLLDEVDVRTGYGSTEFFKAEDILRFALALPAAPGDTLPQAVRDVLAERKHQLEIGYDAAHDDEHVNDEIAAVAAFYIMPPAMRDWPATETGYGDTLGKAIIPEGWHADGHQSRRHQLVMGVAMGLAEIERLDRATMSADGDEK